MSRTARDAAYKARIAAYEAANNAAYEAYKAAKAADESQAGYAEDLVMQIERQAAVIESLRAALDAADRLAEMVRQHAAQHAGHHASSDITTVDIRQEYEFYQEALATVGKAGE